MAIAPFKLETTQESNAVRLKITGSIDESAVFPEVRSEGQITIDLSGVTRLNSVGTRTWCLWIQRFREPADVVLSGCPMLMVKNFSAIKGFLGKRARVFSFIVPFYSEVTGERKDFLATWGVHFDAKGEVRIPEVLDSKGKPMEMDVVPNIYFSFLKP